MEQVVISRMEFGRNKAKIAVLGLSDPLNAAYRVLGPVWAANIEIDMIRQGQTVPGKNDPIFTVSRTKYLQKICVLKSLKSEIGATSLACNARVSKMSIIGVGRRGHVKMVSQIHRSLSEEGLAF